MNLPPFRKRLFRPPPFSPAIILLGILLGNLSGILCLPDATPLWAETKGGRLDITDPGRLQSLIGEWKYRTADRPDFAAANYDDGDWKTFRVTGNFSHPPFGRARVVWFRLTFRLPPLYGNERLALITPLINSAHEVYLNGRKIGGRGIITSDGDPVVRENRINLIHLPSPLPETNVLAFRVADSAGLAGFRTTHFYLGREELIHDFHDSYIIRFAVLSGIFAITGFFFILIFAVWRNESQYLFIGILSWIYSLYALGATTVSYYFIDSLFFNHLAMNLYFTMAMFWTALFIHKFFQQPPNWVIQILGLISALYFLVWIGTNFSIEISRLYNYWILPGMFISYVPFMIYYIYVSHRAIGQQREGARLIFFGLSAVFLTAINDMIVYFHLLPSRQLLYLADLALIGAMAIALALRFRKIYMEIESYNLNVRAELSLAEKIQRRIVPEDICDNGICSLYLPLEKVGGDFFDFLEFRDHNRLGIFICDVSGHGIPAALITSMIKSTINSAGSLREDPAGLLLHLNDVLYEQTEDDFVTAFYGICDFEHRFLHYANAGHIPPLIIGEKKIDRLLITRNLPLAIASNDELQEAGKTYHNYKRTLPATGKLLLYTDGLPESLQHLHSIEERNDYLEGLFLQLHDLNPRQFILTVYRELFLEKSEARIEDDLTLVCLEFQPQ